jgi:uncharacterized membrane protein
MGTDKNALKPRIRRKFKSEFHKIKAARIFLWLASSWGLCFAVMTPPFQVADENRHFWRAYQISEGHFAGVKQSGQPGGLLPKSVVMIGDSTMDMNGNREGKHSIEDTINLFKLPLDESDRAFKGFTFGKYSPIPYLPQSLAIGFGRSLNLPAILLMYLGRIFNLACWIALVFLAIKITPVFKWVFTLLALTPMSLFQAASLSCDSVTNAVAFLTTAYFLFSAFGKDGNLGRKDILILLVLTVSLSLSKSVYFSLVFLYLLIPQGKLVSFKKFILIFLLFIAVNVSSAGLWSYFARSFAVPQNRVEATKKQLEYIISDFSVYPGVIAQTIKIEGDVLFQSYIGKLGWWNVPLPRWHVIPWMALLVLLALIETNKYVGITNKHKLIILGIFGITTLLIFTSTYFFWSRPMAGDINGLQGRYFIPIGPLFFLLFYNRKLSPRIKHLPRILACCSAISLTIALYEILKRFYG